ncbi:MAG: elongation factor P [Chlamydiae bacterium]|nr:elongation factor P [Chlamydiota bacterium]
MSKIATTSNHLAPGMTISSDGKIYRIESVVKVTAPKGAPFIKTKLKDLMSDEIIEKNFKEGQAIQEVSLVEKDLEYLYLEKKDYLFLDIGNLEQILIPHEVIGDKVNYLKEGTLIKAKSYGDQIFAIELPQFLELMVVKTESSEVSTHVANATKIAILETGARIKVPLFIESGDIVKVDTITDEYIQRV